MSLKIQILLLTVLFSIALCDSDEYDSDGSLILTEANWDRVMRSNKKVLCLFAADWCPHCQAFKPEYAKVVQSLKGRIIVAIVNAAKEKACNKKLGVKGVPAVFLITDGDVSKAEKYDGSRDAASLTPWVEKRI